MSSNECSTSHPHEPRIAPVYDAEGRCLVCGIEWRLEELVRTLSADLAPCSPGNHPEATDDAR